MSEEKKEQEKKYIIIFLIVFILVILVDVYFFKASKTEKIENKTIPINGAEFRKIDYNQVDYNEGNINELDKEKAIQENQNLINEVKDGKIQF